MDEPTPRRMILALAPPVMLAGVSSGMAFPILPNVGMRVGLPVAFIGLVLAANRIVRVAVSPSTGALIDRYGGRPAMLVGLLAQVASMLAFVAGVKTSFPGTFFLFGRILHGFGSAGVFIAAQALALHGGGAAHGGRVSGAVRAAVQLGVPLGLVSGGFIADAWGEAATFEIGTVALVLSTITTWLLVPNLRVQAAPRTSVTRALREMGDRRLAAIGALGFASAFAGSGMVLTTTALLVHVEKLSAFGLPERATASVFMGWLVVTEAIAMPWLGRLGDRRDVHAPIAFGGLVLTVPALVFLAYSVRVPTVAIGMGVLGVGVAGLGPSLLALLGRVVPPERRGLGIGALQVCTDIGGALGPLVGSALFTGSLEVPFLVAAGVNALLLPFGWSLIRTTRRAA